MGPLRKPGTSNSTPLPTGSLQVAFPRLLVLVINTRELTCPLTLPGRNVPEAVSPLKVAVWRWGGKRTIENLLSLEATPTPDCPALNKAERM